MVGCVRAAGLAEGCRAANLFVGAGRGSQQPSHAMFLPILFGLQDVNHEISAVKGIREQCTHCHNQQCMTAIRHIKCFSLFFVPLVPVHMDKRLVCGICGAYVKVNSAQLEQLRLRKH